MLKSPLRQLQDYLIKEKITGFLLPRVDCFQGEYIAPAEERLAYITGFTGSAGFALVLQNKAFLFVDGRYRLQAGREVNHREIIVFPWTREAIQTTIEEHFKMGDVLLYDSWLYTPQSLKEWKNHSSGLVLKACDHNPVDLFWKNRPKNTLFPFYVHSHEWCGETAHQKIEKITKILRKKKLSGFFISAPDAVAWLLNIRGNDVPYTPMPHAYGFLEASGNIHMFAALEKISEPLREHCGNTVSWHAMETLLLFLAELPQQVIGIDARTTPQKIVEILEMGDHKIVYQDDPCVLLKALKNTTELEHAKKAHLHDGAALVSFMAWCYAQIKNGAKVTERDAAAKLLSFRQEAPNFVSESFACISASGPHGAIVHYHATAETDRLLSPNEIYLIDSGGQYKGATTDVTRTLCFSEASPKEKACYTRVLKGHIAIARLIFPVGTPGHAIDAFARQFLWQIGKDYQHGTGHGVGSFLSVHEGPQRISKANFSVPLQEGMILSNEPGYYEEDAFGIRIENLIHVAPAKTSCGFLCFETLTCAPFEKALIDTSLLTSEEINWINTYHAWVLKSLALLIEEETRRWLEAACAPICYS